VLQNFSISILIAISMVSSIAMSITILIASLLWKVAVGFQ
jgi:hypothetical protein